MPEGAGEIIYESRGRITSRRVLEVKNGRSVIEYGYEAVGTLAGHEITDVITYQAEEVIQGSFVGWANGITLAGDGSSVVWRSQAATVREEGSTELFWKGFMALESQSSKFSRLNGAILEFVAHIHDDGNASLRAQRWR